MISKKMRRFLEVFFDRDTVQGIPAVLPGGPYRKLYASLFKRYYREMVARRTRETADDYSFKPFIDLNCVFVHIPKCAGVSTCKSLFGNLAGGHTTIADYRVILTDAEFREFFKFTIVRNPWDRLVSAYHFLKQGGMNAFDQQWAERNLTRFDDFETFVKHGITNPKIQQGLHFRPQSRFICFPGRSKIMVDFVGYLENIDEDFEIIRNRIGVDATMMSANRTKKRSKDYRSDYTDETREIVARIYRRDLELFGYDFENSNLEAQLQARQSPLITQSDLPITTER